MPDSDTFESPRPIHIGLLLIDGFALMSYASLIEPFRAANRLAGRELYVWTHVATGAAGAAASNGISVRAECVIGPLLACDRLFVFAANDAEHYREEACLGWLRRMARVGTVIGGVSGGPYLLARAGLLDGHRATIHWEHAPMLCEEFPDLAIEPCLSVIDGRRMTCAGGTAGLDLAISLIAMDHGEALASRVAEWFIRTEARSPDLAQRASTSERHVTRHPRVLAMLEAMERAIEEPLSREALAERAGLSLRQLERLCRAELGAGIAAAYCHVRLDRAAHLLRATGLAVTEIAIACGFRNAGHFSRRFKARFGFSPREREGRRYGP